ncbi:glycosyltransferase family 4 protein [Maribellus maritimus]|uniref:glycosyltransferase family 4 protein n=1 Tax=Maribellus maritimus TaxID=2870838 RepID=UPI001EE9BBCE|nr:glycosyltransferase family 4 protein [Maribellus maritimus]MCG6191228.1 glycosyltransferase family 4 protein [Maribellus maritimus]
MNKINLAFILSTLQLCGPINQTLNLISSLNTEKFNPIVITLSHESKNSLIKSFKEKKITVIQLGLPRWSIILGIFSVKKILIKDNIDIIHSQGFRSDIISFFAKSNQKILSTTRSEPYKTNLTKYGKFIARLITDIHYYFLMKFDKIVVPSKTISEKISQLKGIDCEIVLNAVDFDKFHPASVKEKKKKRKKYGFKTDQKIYLMLGDLIPRKNAKIAIEAFNTFHKEENLILLIVGDGYEKDYLKKLKKTESIIFIKRTNNPKEYLQIADYIISASLSEGLPNSILEGISCGLYPILSNIDSHTEIINKIKIGTLFNVNSREDLIEQIRLSSNIKLNLQHDIRQSGLSFFSKDIMAKSYQNIYQMLYHN